ncbi:MAG: DUF4185 domain-containing protein [Polyangia bacterium]
MLLLPRLGSAFDPPDPLSVLFVADGWYEQEDEIESHLIDLGYDVAVKADYQVYGSTDLSGYDLVVISEFAPNLSYSALDNIESSGAPVLIVEYWDFWYSYQLGLTSTEQCGYAGTDTVDVITHDHPVTRTLDDELDVYETSYTVYGMDSSDVEPGVTELIWSSESFGEAAVLVDDARSIAATGIYETGRYTPEAWMLFDLLVTHVTRGQVFPPAPRDVFRRLAWCGAAEFLGELSEDRDLWTPSEARAEIWPMLVRGGVTSIHDDVFELIDLVLVHDWALVATLSPTGASPALKSILYVPPTPKGPPDYVQIDECFVDFTLEIMDESNAFLPLSADYTAEAAGVPRISFHTEPWLSGDLFTSEAENFSVCLTSTESFGDVVLFKTGATSLFGRNDLFELNEPPLGDCLSYWWGRYTNNILFADPDIVEDQELSFMREPFSLVSRVFGEESKQVALSLDFFSFEEGSVESKREPKCAVRFFEHPYADGDGAVDDASFLDFETEKMPAPLPLGGNDVANECNTNPTFNPFSDQDSWGWPGDPFLPNTFGDATAGSNEGMDEDLDPLLPRVQLMWPSNHFVSKHHPVEAFCEAHAGVCKDLAGDSPDPVNVEMFNIWFGLEMLAERVPEYASYGRELLTERRRDDVPWAGDSLDQDRGPWQKPTIQAGLETRLRFLVRNEKDNIPVGTAGEDLYDRAFCTPPGSGVLSGTARIHYRSRKDGSWIDGETIELYCRPLAEEDLSYTHGTYEGEGLTLVSDDRVTFPTIADFGSAKISLEGQLKLATSGGGTEITVNREYPVFVIPVDAFVSGDVFEERFSKMEAQPAAWIGAGALNPLKLGKYRNSAFQKYAQSPVAEGGLGCGEDSVEPICRALYWLVNADEGPWVMRHWTGHEDKLFSLFGDISVFWQDPLGKIDFDWFDYRGSGMAFEHVDQQWIPDSDCGTYFPALVPVLTDNGLPWEITRAPGVEVENGVFYESGCDTPNVSGCIKDCHETGAETVAPTSAFQLQSQHDSGESYVWFGVASDWGRSMIQGMEEDSGSSEDPLTELNIGTYHYSYDVEYPRWWSFIGRLYPNSGLDDLGRSVSWRSLGNYGNEATTFVWSSAVPVDNLGSLLGSHLVDGEETSFQGPGILVWHTGRYRASPVYLSYAREQALLDPAAYRHFVGWDDGGMPTWSSLEQDTNPVIWDNAGEITAMDLGGGNDTIFERFVLLYQVNSDGQEGIVLRQASDAWGPYSHPTVIYDCAPNREEMLEVAYPELVPKQSRLDGFSACYGGFTHRSLWTPPSKGQGDQVESDQTKLRFNVSLWRPYKGLLVESTMQRNQ